jgi:hypothetical protein
MAEIKEITAINTIPSIPPLLGVAPLVHALRASDGQIWPLGSAGTAVAQVLTPQKFGFFADGWSWVAQSLGSFGWPVGWSVGQSVSQLLSRSQVLWW